MSIREHERGETYHKRPAYTKKIALLNIDEQYIYLTRSLHVTHAYMSEDEVKNYLYHAHALYQLMPYIQFLRDSGEALLDISTVVALRELDEHLSQTLLLMELDIEHATKRMIVEVASKQITQRYTTFMTSWYHFIHDTHQEYLLSAYQNMRRSVVGKRLPGDIRAIEMSDYLELLTPSQLSTVCSYAAGHFNSEVLADISECYSWIGHIRNYCAHDGFTMLLAHKDCCPWEQACPTIVSIIKSAGLNPKVLTFADDNLLARGVAAECMAYALSVRDTRKADKTVRALERVFGLYQALSEQVLFDDSVKMVFELIEVLCVNLRDEYDLSETHQLSSTMGIDYGSMIEQETKRGSAKELSDSVVLLAKSAHELGSVAMKLVRARLSHK